MRFRTVMSRLCLVGLSLSAIVNIGNASETKVLLHETLLKKTKHSEPGVIARSSKAAAELLEASDISNLRSADVLPRLRTHMKKEATLNREVPLLTRRLQDNFGLFRNDVIRIGRDRNESMPMRMLMLEILHSMRTDAKAKEAMLDVFRSEDASSRVGGYAARYLCEQGADIGKEVLEKLDDADNKTTPLYLRALKKLKYNDALEPVRSAMTRSKDFNTRLAAIEALGGLSDDDGQSSRMLAAVIETRGAKRTASLSDEIEAMRAAAALAELGAENIDRLLEIVSNPALRTDVRMRAAESLPRIESGRNGAICVELRRIKTSLDSEGLSAIERKKLALMIELSIKQMQQQTGTSGTKR